MNPEGEADVGDDEDIRATIVHDAYLAGLRAGEAPDPERLLAENPALAGRLRALIAADNLIACVAGEVVPELEDYRVVRTLGRGGMGIVYQAEQRSRGRQVALKVLTPAAAMDPQQLRRFLLVEVPAARLLRHPRIVPVIDAGCENGAYFYAMQLIEGRDLAQWIAAGPAPPSPDSAEALDPPRRAARWGLQVAEALEYAHEQGVLHRDIKPSNLMLDPRGDVWVTDFGLAHIQGEAHLTATGDLPGTPRYMSPEQILAGRVVIDHRTDIYSLGVTLYEILTRRPAFDGDSPRDVMRRVVEREPRAPRRIDPAIPVDLETIVLKAMAREREDRYGTAGELADDLRHFLAGEPIAARRPGPLELLSRSARKHRRAVATAAVLLLLAVLGLTASVILISQARSRAIAAGALADERARESRYESLLQRILRLRLTPHSSGWSTEAWDLVREAAGLRPEGSDSLQGQAAATLIDMDAHLVKQISPPATDLAFDPDGRRLWMCGSDGALQVWDRVTDRIESMSVGGAGPIAVRDGGGIVHLAAIRGAMSGRPSLRLWDVTTQNAKDFDLPDGSETVRAHALSPDGSYVGAVVESVGGSRIIRIWASASGRTLPPIEYGATQLAFSPDASRLVACDGEGAIRTWTLPDLTPMPPLRSAGIAIRSVAFGRVPGRAEGKPRDWLLAVGDAGGTVTIWDLENRVPINYCRGSQFDVYSVAFSADGTTLASAGRNHARLWDVVTGRLLLELKLRNIMTSLAFSPDGSRLAVGSQDGFGSIGVVDVYELEDGRGIPTLRGLRGQVQKTIFSPDGRLVAGLSHDWQVAIWDRKTRRIRLILDVPQGLVADNSGLAFSPDGRRFAFSAGNRAKLWDLDSGGELQAWKLPDGLQDTLAFHGTNHLVLIRMEIEHGRSFGAGMTNRDVYPRVLTLRNLLGVQPTTPLRVIKDFDWHLHRANITSDGRYFVAEGLAGPGGENRSVNAYDARTGDRLWSLPSGKKPIEGSWFRIDPTGEILSLDTGGRTALLSLPTGAVQGELSDSPRCLGPGGMLWLGIEAGKEHGQNVSYSIHNSESRDRGFQVAISPRSSSGWTEFCPDGRSVVWGNENGSVSICDLIDVRRRLAEIGLGR